MSYLNIKMFRSCYGLTALDLTTSDLVKQAIEEHQVLTQATNESLNSQSFSVSLPYLSNWGYVAYQSVNAELRFLSTEATQNI